MRKMIVMLLCLTAFATAATPVVSVKDLIFRQDGYSVYEEDGTPTLRASSILNNNTAKTVKGLTAHITWMALDGTVLRQMDDPLPPIKPGEYLYWMPPFYNPGRILVQIRLDILQDGQVVSSRTEAE